MSSLIIVESPTKAKTLSKFLGKEYEVEATMGHIKDLPKSVLGIDVEKNFKPDYVEVPKKLETIKKLQSLAKKNSKVYIATDPDREGEAIASHVAEIIPTKSKLSRIVFHEITKEAVEEAIKNPRGVDTDLVNAQIARRVLDRLVGYKLSPLLWKKVRRGLSAGRVQTVAVRLIVEREREVEKFKPVEYWEIYVDVKRKVGKKEAFRVMLVGVGEEKAEVADKKTADKIVADLKKASYEVREVKKKEVRKKPFPPFTTSTMTQAGARIFGWSAKRTMQIAQKLYEEGLITYHRTDSFNIAAQAIDKTRKFIGKVYGETYLPESPRVYKTQSKVAQEAHEAIRPTSVNVDKVADDATNDEKKLYDLICRRFLACQMSDSVYDETTIDVGATKYLLRASGQIMRFDGWRRVVPAKLQMEEAVKLPEVEAKESLTYVDIDPEQKFTQPPPRFNEASLIKTLEKLGIGRPSTYAPIISTIQLRTYVEKDEGKFFPTPVGIAVNDFLLEHFPDVFKYSFTAGMENGLDEVAEGKRKWTLEIGNFWKPFIKKLTGVEKKAQRVKIATEKLGQKCPECKDGELVIRIGRFGKFVSCSTFPECKYTAKYLEKVGMKCPDCKEGDVILKRTGKGRKFFGCSRYPECKWASWRKPQNEKEKPAISAIS